jgi:hypothetical protein
MSEGLNERMSELINHSLILSFAHSLIKKSGSSSVGRAIAFQAIGREFEPRLPLILMSDFEFSISDLEHQMKKLDKMTGFTNPKLNIRNPISKLADVAQG